MEKINIELTEREIRQLALCAANSSEEAAELSQKPMNTESMLMIQRTMADEYNRLAIKMLRIAGLYKVDDERGKLQFDGSM